MPSITKTYHVLAVRDLNRSAVYYSEVLGFSISEIGDPGWRFFDLDSCRIMVGECPDAMPPKDTGDHSYFAYLFVDGISDLFKQVNQMGGDFTKQLKDEPWGMREFGLRTIDGHRIMFGEEIPQQNG